MLRLVLFAILVGVATCEFTKLQYSFCGTTQLSIFEFDISPMPIRHPAKTNLILSGESKRAITGKVKSDIKIIRTVTGIALDVRCYVVDGYNVGSCVYDDLCPILKSVFAVDEDNCPQNLIDNGLQCKCPFNLPKRALDIQQEFNLPDASKTKLTWLASGDFDVTVKASDAAGPVTCLNVKFTVKPI